MRLHAASVGYRAHAASRHGEEARVLGVFEHACSLLGGDGWVRALLTRLRPGPMNLVVPSLGRAIARLRPGQQARFVDQNIILAEAGLVVELEGAVVWPGVALPAGPLAGERARHADVLQALTLAQDVPARQGWMAWLPEFLGCAPGQGARSEAAGSSGPHASPWPLAPWAVAAARGLRQSICDRRIDQACAYVRDMIGVGPGLTPAGDDFLAGLLVAFDYAGRAGPDRLDWLAPLTEEAAAWARGHTTLVGEQQLRLAASGEADQALGQAAVAVLWDVQPVEAPLLELLHLGSSSGGDTLAGICFASEVLSLVVPARLGSDSACEVTGREADVGGLQAPQPKGEQS